MSCVQTKGGSISSTTFFVELDLFQVFLMCSVWGSCKDEHPFSVSGPALLSLCYYSGIGKPFEDHHLPATNLGYTHLPATNITTPISQQPTSATPISQQPTSATPISQLHPSLGEVHVGKKKLSRSSNQRVGRLSM